MAWGSLWTEIHGCLFRLQLLEDLKLYGLWAVACSKELSTMPETWHLGFGKGVTSAVPSRSLASLVLWTIELWSRPFHSEN